jgi:hypothetical protein
MVNDVGEFWPLGWIGWGYPQSSSIDRWIFHETNHPAFGVFLWLWKPPNVHQGITPSTHPAETFGCVCWAC